MIRPVRAVQIRLILTFAIMTALVILAPLSRAEENKVPVENKKPQAVNVVPADKLPWWPTDAQPAPVKDDSRGGYWWWPKEPGKVKDLWGNRGYAYVNKIIYNWHGAAAGAKHVQVNVDTVTGEVTEMKPSLVIKRSIRDYALGFTDKQIDLAPEHDLLLKKILASLRQNNSASLLITCDAAPDDVLAKLLGEQRSAAVEKFFLGQGIDQARIKIVAAGKFQEAGLRSRQTSSTNGLQLMIAEVTEVFIPGPAEPAP